MDKFIAHLKGSIKSWTIWFNGLSLAVISSLPVLQEQLPQLKDYISDGDYKRAALVLIVGNAILRIKTNRSLAEK